MKPFTLRFFLLAGWLLLGFSLSAQAQPKAEKTIKNRLASYFQNYTTPYTTPGERCKIERVKADAPARTLHIYTNELFAAQPFTRENTAQIYRSVKRLLPAPYNTWRVIIYGMDTPIEELIPNAWSDTPSARRTWGDIRHKGNPWVTRLSRPYSITAGLQDRHLAVWASHGRYYRQKKSDWGWQRPRLYCTAEDLFTQTIVVPFLIPMLENAGACVFTPRERDWQKHEVIVDNDTPQSEGRYAEINGKFAWRDCTTGFARRKAVYADNENPFADGTVRGTDTQPRSTQLSTLTWTPDIPVDGRYAVYVSYATLPTSVSDAQYTVHHRGISTRFRVNQQMGGGTWVYLGTFDFEKGCSKQNCVTLTNQSNYRGVVTADAVRFGGGMGNIARGDSLTVPCVSGLPRFLEGARYSAQWAGIPYTIYGAKSGRSDYGDDINTRSYMTNYLASGSAYLPADSGLHVPLELCVALHSDAGYRKDKTLIGSLGIYTTKFYDGQLATGLSRLASRDLCDMVLTQVDNDLKRTYGRWNRRQMFDRNYSETREPQIPSIILEMLSHQNFADLKLGHDPSFKFTLARAVYKGILRYTTALHGNCDVTVQPLPVKNAATQINPVENTITLTWAPQPDPLEPKALPHGYVVYTRMGNGDFDNGTYCKDATLTLRAQPDLLYSFRISAVNDGGESLLGEELCALIASKSRAKVLIVDGFQRVAGPQPIDNDSLLGFDMRLDPGVAYGHSPGFCGRQLYFNKDGYGREEENGLGFSGTELEGMLVAGNTRDFATLHGRDIQATGLYSFASCSRGAVEQQIVNLNDYDAVDLILGLERNDGYSTVPFKTFTPALRRALEDYTRLRGNVLVSGAYVASDMQTEEERRFTARTLKYQPAGSVSTETIGGLSGMNTQFDIYRSLNEERYAVTWADCLAPADEGAYCAMLYESCGRCAAVAYAGKDYRCMVLGFPFESIRQTDKRRKMMAGILKFLVTR